MAPRRSLTQQGELLKLTGDTFTIKEELKRIGARYDGAQKCWFVSAEESNLKKLEFLGFLVLQPLASAPLEKLSDELSKTEVQGNEDVTEKSGDFFTVSQFTSFVENVFRRHLGFDFWIVGEVSSLKSSSGHVYFDLIEPEQERALQTGRAASVSCCFWAGKIRQLSEKISNFPLAEGIKIKLKVHCDFRKEGSRLNLIVDDIDPQYTLGDLALQRQNIVRELKRRGLYDRQRLHAKWPDFPLRIALLTAAGSRAQTDFLDELKISKLSFQVTLFDCHMQGEKVERDITKALAEISADGESSFDCVVITRGGGSRLDLRWFDNLEIGKSIAYCTLPVLTAIGHFEDISIADEVASVAEKTPTGAARFLAQSILNGFEKILSRLERAARVSQARIQRERQWIERFEITLQQSTRRRVEKEKDKLSDSQRALRLVQKTAAQPLRLGYSILRAQDGRTLKADDFLTSGFPESVQVELFSTDKNAQVLVDLQVTAVQQKSSNTLVTESISLSTSPQNQGL